ncbi:MAG: hypothetical protein AAF478_09640, partial [Pseudomonadota bacterium]
MKFPDISIANYAAAAKGSAMVEGEHKNGQHAEAQDFPTLLNIDWPAEGEASGASGNGVEAEGMEAQLQALKSINEGTALLDDTGTNKHPHNMSKNAPEVLAGYFLFNSQFNVSIQVAEPADSATEAKLLIDGFNKAIEKTGALSYPDIDTGSTPELRQSHTADPEFSSQPSLIQTTQVGMNVSGANSERLAATISQTNRSAVGSAGHRDTEFAVVDNQSANADKSQSLPVLPGKVLADAARVNLTLPPNMKPAEALPQTNQANAPVNDGSSVEVMSTKVKTKSSGNENQIQFPSQVTVAALPNIAARISASLETRQSAQTADIPGSGSTTENKTVKVVELQLVPKNLGLVELKISRTNYGAQILIQVETVEAERLLMAEKVSVYEAMRSVGMPVEDMKITLMSKADLEQQLAKGEHGNNASSQQDPSENSPGEF